MSVSHCPICPLIFQFRTEVEYHLRNDHRSRADEELDLRDELQAAQSDLTWLRLRALQSAVSEPSVSLLLDTMPAKAMTSLDAARLRRLAHKARQRLSLEVRGGDLSNLEHRLARAVAAAEGGPTDAGIAVFVSARQLTIIRLPLEPKERVVIDPTFATRDLFDALQSSPRYRVAVLGGAGPRLFEGRGHSLTDVSDAHTTGALTAPRRGIGRGDAGRVEPWSLRHHRLQASVRMTDDALDTRCAVTGSLPLVVVGGPRLVALFHRRSHHERDLIGHVQRMQTRPSAHDVERLVAPVVDAWHRQLADAQAARLEQADSQRQLAWGAETALPAVLAGKVEHLWVQRGYMVPARTLGDGTLQIVDNPEIPGVIDDIVDDLIEIAISKGTPTDIVHINASDHPRGGVAVQLRPSATAAGPTKPERTTAA